MQNTICDNAIKEQPKFNFFGDSDSNYEKFIRFHKKNPRVYELFKAFAFSLIKKGHRRLGGRMIIERIRWEMATGEKDDMGFKINNLYIAHYTRLFTQEHKEYVEYFETRTIRTP